MTTDTTTSSPIYFFVLQFRGREIADRRGGGGGWGVPRGMQEPAGYEQEEPQGR